MPRKCAYPATISSDDSGRYLVSFPDFPEAATGADSLRDALEAAGDSLDQAVRRRLREGASLPPPSPRGWGQVLVAVHTQP